MRALLAAGGTGGHLFPAEALASVLERRGHEVELVTDRRATTLVATFPADEVHFIEAATLAGKSPVAMAKMAVANAAGLVRSLQAMRRFQPDVAVGFGGYPTLPPLTAARLLKVPAIVHEANAVIGRANKSLARHAHVATSFPTVEGLPAAQAATHVGIPVREAVLKAVAPYEPPAEHFNLLVFGGSQGARAFSDMVPPSIAILPKEMRARLQIVQQARPEDVERVRAAYRELGVAAEIAPFFKDLPKRIAGAHLVIARSGASTVAELSIIGRPGLLVPLPGALDQDQAHNAAALEALGGARRLDQKALTPEVLAKELNTLIGDPVRLALMAEHAKGLARPDAAERLADLAERIAAGDDA
ncbi:undecaprenyldiphospho-muramoylpentapeptide beta-N-acetylglucosaminyltransferase [Acuticoccus sediminis]|uniref:UDP-N-acetylglucosamine--N-acetylmuramyl-(pentapeptide) pyrophosphoryl-undecaprenol N-acetylglucosamine transferase n=1 Tax=Acuticoccus sediminis TaxID=2184697 RepID=A0A8B2NQ86_9HYPH|nr:undecaprenyldiphospho-muramoylpentapeptide beta-N-acetylglucosaminyltransferase [Acuticoccus sediminis]RAH97051.1 undecaprenyldiphospho-muramoylpentapeptide beta-N-acetylglucosaminyltransferase [Acuticoccus sediminis]